MVHSTKVTVKSLKIITPYLNEKVYKNKCIIMDSTENFFFLQRTTSKRKPISSVELQENVKCGIEFQTIIKKYEFDECYVSFRFLLRRVLVFVNLTILYLHPYYVTIKA